MRRNSALLCSCFCAGLLAAIVSTAFAWFCSHYGITGWLNVTLSTPFSLPTLYPRMIWGGLWGLLFALTVLPLRSRRQWVRKGLLISILPTLYQLFVIYPYHTSYGTLGIELGLLAPLVVLVYNLVWGFFTGFFSRLLWGKG